MTNETNKEMDEIDVYFNRKYKLLDLKIDVNNLMHEVHMRNTSYIDALSNINELFKKYMDECLNEPKPN